MSVRQALVNTCISVYKQPSPHQPLFFSLLRLMRQKKKKNQLIMLLRMENATSLVPNSFLLLTEL